MKSYDVFLESFVNVSLPDNVNPETTEGYRMLHEAAVRTYLARLQTPGEVTFTWERYEEGDTTNG